MTVQCHAAMRSSGDCSQTTLLAYTTQKDTSRRVATHEVLRVNLATRKTL